MYYTALIFQIACLKAHYTYSELLYSRKISRAPIFEDFKDFLLTSKVLSTKFLAADQKQVNILCSLL